MTLPPALGVIASTNALSDDVYVQPAAVLANVAPGGPDVGSSSSGGGGGGLATGAGGGGRGKSSCALRKVILPLVPIRGSSSRSR